jgi:hypothetical protein
MFRSTRKDAASTENLLHFALLRGVLGRGEPPRTPQQQKQKTVALAMQTVPQAAAVPPITPAERFQQVNKGLPDGVVYEPLDEQTKSLLRSMNKTQAAESVPQPPQQFQQPLQQPLQQPPKQADIPQNADLLERLIQDERNASVFYRFLSGVAPAGEYQETLSHIAGECAARYGRYRQLLQDTDGHDFAPEETVINPSAGYAAGVRFAVAEEHKMLRAMADLLDSGFEGEHARVVQGLFNKKLVRQQWLMWAASQA